MYRAIKIHCANPPFLVLCGWQCYIKQTVIDFGPLINRKEHEIQS
jgi:hypothetical protein